jgi:hypothetical protein
VINILAEILNSEILDNLMSKEATTWVNQDQTQPIQDGKVENEDT